MTAEALPRLHVTIVAMTVGFGMAPYAQMLPEAVSRYCDVTLLLPEHFSDTITGAKVVKFRTGRTPRQALYRSMAPLSHIDFLDKLHQTKPDVVHLLNGHGYPWALASAALGPKPLLTTLHDPDPHPGNRVDAISAGLGEFTLKRSAGIHIHDEVFRPGLAARFPEKSIFVIRHPSYASRYLRYAKPGIVRQRQVLFFGRIEQYKGIEILLRAAAIMPPDIHITIAGIGTISALEKQAITDLGSRVIFLNRFIQDDEAALLMQQAGVLALPYIQATQSSLPLISAAFGLPMVASSVGSFCTEVPSLGGVLVPPSDPQALANALLRQIETPAPIHNKQETFDDLAPRFIDMYRKISA